MKQGNPKANTSLQLPRKAIADFCKRNGIRKLALFGSALEGRLKPESDIDLLIEFYPAKTPGFIGLAGMEIELTKLLGRKVDLRTAQDLSRYFRKEVVKSARVQYAER
ncbi:MAG: nucleotidyltransferase family protein [Nitrospirae bacterium]|nr:nucleotidyltransferase family protein [Nitrospirota bacterium]MCL5977639.1 nucleotidyltransferase family protein [Nitrospirota bacterium]